MLEVKNLHATIAGKEILKGINLTINDGEIHAIMGPNGSGKSTLSAVLTGNPLYTVTEGEAIFNGKNLLDMKPEDRAREGLFLSFQYPVEIPGVSMTNFMRAAINAKREYQGLEPLNTSEFMKLMREKRELVELDSKLARRSVNEGFSGGEKKRNEIFQMAMLEPKLSILDETDSGLDVDAMRIVADGVNKMHTDKTSAIVITHYERLLDMIKPSVVHVLYKGRIVKTAGPELAKEIEARGYDWIKAEVDEKNKEDGYAFRKQYLDLYQSSSRMIKRNSAEVLNAVRDAAFEDFRRLGFPSRKVERYKYTDMSAIFEPDYGLNLNRLEIPVDPYQAFRCDVPNLSTSLYFVVNDAFYNKALPKVELPEGVIVDSLSKIAAENPEFIGKYYAKIAKTDEDGITALNTVLAQDGLFIYVPKNVKVERTVQVINILRSDVDLMVNRRVLIVLEQGAEAKFLFCDHAADDKNFLATQVIEAFVGENASLDLYCLEETHYKNRRVSNVYIEQQANSRVNHNVITLHNGITRNRLDLVFKGEGAECFCNGCVIADKNQVVDNNTLIDHQVGHCTSNELYKYVLDGEARGAFAGRVLVRHGAQKTISQETNQNLCATKTARMFTQPMLEIYADDVKCAHGSTVGQLNDAALFYMQQRGVSLEEAKLLLQFAFINEVIDKMELEPLRDRLHHLVEKRFRGELNKCEGCKLCK